MEKINFINQSTPALNATNLNKLQDNVEDAINELDILEPQTIYIESDTDTYACNYINDLYKNVYSTTETRIGTYMNKPLYRKTFNFTTPNNGNFTSITGTTISNIDKIVNEYGFVDTENQTPLNYYYDSSDNCHAHYYKGEGNIKVLCRYAGSRDKTAHFTVEYTKTTD